MAVQFTDPRVGRRCNSAAAVDRAWGDAARDVRTSLIVLAESTDLDAYAHLPNVLNEGDETVFMGIAADVILNLTATAGPPPGVIVGQIDVRDRRSST